MDMIANDQQMKTLIAASTASALGLIAVFAGTFPVFLGAISHEHAISSNLFSGLLLIAAISFSCCNIITGWAVDRFGPRSVSVPGIFLFGVCIFALSQSDRVGWAIVPLYLLLGIGGSLCGPVPNAAAISGWFEQRRGAALGLAITASPLISSAITVPIVAVLVERYGWRAAYEILGGIIVVVGGASQWLFLSNPPQAPEKFSSHGAVSPFGVNLGTALRSWPFWLFTIAVAVCGTVTVGVSGQLLGIAAEAGMSRTTAVLSISCLAGAGLIGALTAGVLIDKVKSPRSVIICIAITLAGAALLRVSTQPLQFLVACSLIGAGNYSVGATLPYLVGRFYGLRHMGEIYGSSMALVSISSGTGPLIFSLAHMSGFHFADVLGVCSLFLLLCMGPILVLRRYPDVAQIEIFPS